MKQAALAGLCFFLIVFYIMVEAEVSCPVKNSNETDILADSTNCSRFYICDTGQAFLQNCSAGLYFNPELKVCDRQENVVFCEYDDLVYMKPYCDCHMYVICDYGTLNIQECPKGYHFNSSADISFYSSEPCEAGGCG